MLSRSYERMMEISPYELNKILCGLKHKGQTHILILLKDLT